jgi:hypothetical protein
MRAEAMNENDRIPVIKSSAVGPMFTIQPWFIALVSSDGSRYWCLNISETRREAEDEIRKWMATCSGVNAQFYLVVEVDLPCAVPNWPADCCPDCGAPFYPKCGTSMKECRCGNEKKKEDKPT